MVFKGACVGILLGEDTKSKCTLTKRIPVAMEKEVSETLGLDSICEVFSLAFLSSLDR